MRLALVFYCHNVSELGFVSRQTIVEVYMDEDVNSILGTPIRALGRARCIENPSYSMSLHHAYRSALR